MAAPHEQHWSNEEKIHLLVEIIKANPDQNALNTLLSLINGRRMQPDWNEILIPTGRSVNASRRTYEEIRRMQPGTDFPGCLGLPTPSPLPAPTQAKRANPFDSGFPGARQIMPKPPSAVSSIHSQLSPMEQPPRKKRGRPTKAEAQSRAEAQRASGDPGRTLRSEPDVPSTPMQAPGLPPEVSSSAPPREMHEPVPASQLHRGFPSNADPMITPVHHTPPIVRKQEGEVRTSLPPVSRVPISSILTPVGPKSASQSSSSSGKRKRGRSTRSEQGGLAEAQAEGGPDDPYGWSPSARVTTDSQGTPARTAALRRREEAERGAQQSRSQEAFARPLPGPPPT